MKAMGKGDGGRRWVKEIGVGNASKKGVARLGGYLTLQVATHHVIPFRLEYRRNDAIAVSAATNYLPKHLLPTSSNTSKQHHPHNADRSLH